MNILMLTPYLPYPLLSGGQIRTYNLLKKLATKHQVTLFALIKDYEEQQYVPELEKYCAEVQVFKRSSKPFTLKNIVHTAVSTYPFLVIRNHVPQVTDAVQEQLQSNKFDLIHAETFYMMPHLPQTEIPTILVEQTIEYLGYESYANKAPKIIRPLLDLDIQKIKKWEKHYWQECDLLITMSEEDKEFISDVTGKEDKIQVVANGVDSPWFAEKKRKTKSVPTVLSVGTFKWLPNVEAVSFLIEKVWPHITKAIPEAQLSVVGNAPTPKVMSYADEDSSIKVLGRVPDIRDAFTESHVLIAPVFSGKGTRYKVLEAMAAGTPVVATSTAVEGLAVKDGTHVLISDTAEGLAKLTIKLLKDDKLRAKLAKNSRQFVKKNFDWELISEKLDTIYQSMGKRPHS